MAARKKRPAAPSSPRLALFAEVASRWLADFETRVATGERRQRTLEHYRHALARHLLPALGHRQLQPITADDLATLVSDLRAKQLSPWTVSGLLVPLSCVSSTSASAADSSPANPLPPAPSR